MPRRKSTKTKAEWEKEARDKAKAKKRASCAKQSADAVTWAVPKPCITQAGGKTPQEQLAAKATCRAVPTKPHMHYAIITMREICHFQKSVDLLIPLLPFQHLICEIAQGFRMDLHFQICAILALQEAADTWLVQLFESANLCAIHCGRQTIAPKDFHLVKAIHRIAGINLWWK